MIDDFAVCSHHIKVKAIGILAFDVPQQGFAEASCLHHPTHSISLEEGVEFRDGSVQGLGKGTTLEVKVHLFWM
jgi:hypothetical protein